MNAAEHWPLLFNTSSPSDHGTPLRLKVLYSNRKQALMIPLQMQQAHQAVNFFMHKPLLKIWGHLCIKLDYYLPWLQLLPSIEFEHFPLKTLFGVIATENNQELAGIAIFCGFPGALQKLTIYCPNQLGGLGKVAKVAAHATANSAVKKEAHWLEKLGHTTATARFLPQLLQHSWLACQRHSLTMMSLDKGVTPKKFGMAHHAFLRALAQQRPIFTEWKVSEAHMRLKRRIDSLSSVVDEETWLFWQQIVTEIERATAGLALPNLTIHGDFAPWNLRQIGNALFVFDWEYAETYGNPVQDFVHFHLITQALKRSGLSHKVMKQLLQKISIYVDKQYGADVGIAKASAALTLHYLLDTITFYAQASGYLDAQHPVLRNYIKVLQQRAEWIPDKPALTSSKQAQQQQHDTGLELT